MPKQPAAPLNEDRLSYAAEMLKVMGHPVRLRIIELLEVRHELPAGVIQEELQEPQPTVSQHLGKMRALGLLKARRLKGQMLYSVSQMQLFTLLNCIRNCE